MTELKTQLLHWAFPELNLGILELIEDLFNKRYLEALCKVSKPEQLYMCDYFQRRGETRIRTGISAAPH